MLDSPSSITAAPAKCLITADCKNTCWAFLFLSNWNNPSACQQLNSGEGLVFAENKQWCCEEFPSEASKKKKKNTSTRHLMTMAGKKKRQRENTVLEIAFLCASDEIWQSLKSHVHFLTRRRRRLYRTCRPRCAVSTSCHSDYLWGAGRKNTHIILWVVFLRRRFSDSEDVSHMVKRGPTNMAAKPAFSTF